MENAEVRLMLSQRFYYAKVFLQQCVKPISVTSFVSSDPSQ